MFNMGLFIEWFMLHIVINKSVDDINTELTINLIHNIPIK